MSTFAIRWWTPVVKTTKPHCLWPPKSKVDERDALEAIRDKSLSKIHERTLHNQFQELFLDSVDNCVQWSIITPWFIETVWWLCSILDIWKGDEVICSPFADYALYETIKMTWATIRIHWADKETGKVRVEDVTDLITEQTKIIFVTHHRWFIQDIQGIQSSLDAIKGANPIVVEDCSYAHWWKHDTTKAGTAGDIGIFPLSYEKLIFTGQWAIVITNNRLIIDCMKQLLYYWFQSHDQYLPKELEEKYLLSPLHATMWKYSLRQFLFFSRWAEKCLHYLRKRLEVVSYCKLVGDGINQASRYGFILKYDKTKLRKLPVEWLVKLLRAEGVQARCSEDSVVECLSDKWELLDSEAYTLSKSLIYLPSFYDRYEHKDVIDEYVAALRKIQLNLFS